MFKYVPGGWFDTFDTYTYVPLDKLPQVLGFSWDGSCLGWYRGLLGVQCQRPRKVDASTVHGAHAADVLLLKIWILGDEVPKLASDVQHLNRVNIPVRILIIANQPCFMGYFVYAHCCLHKTPGLIIEESDCSPCASSSHDGAKRTLPRLFPSCLSMAVYLMQMDLD